MAGRGTKAQASCMSNLEVQPDQATAFLEGARCRDGDVRIACFKRIATVMIALMLTSCSALSGGSAASGSAKAKALVLTASDFPTGWSVVSGGGGGSTNGSSADIVRLAACDGAANPNTIDEGGYDGTAFEDRSDAESAYSNAFFVRTRGDAEADLTALSSAKFAPCLKTFLLPKDRAALRSGFSLTGLSIAPLTVAPVGDQSVAYRITQQLHLSGEAAAEAHLAQGDFYDDYVYIRKGAAEVAVQFDSFTGQPFDSALEAVLLGRLEAKLQILASTSTVPSVVLPSPTSAITIPTTPSPPTNTTPSYILAAPDGYRLSTGSETHNGPIAPSDFDNVVGAGFAASTHFLHGYDVTYYSNSTHESIESTLFTFGSPADATGFEPQILATAGAAYLSPTRSSLSSIPGSGMLTGTKAGPDGFYLLDVIAVKGATLMEVEYANNARITDVPGVLSMSASLQYARL
jgi:hypothetical protein